MKTTFRLLSVTLLSALLTACISTNQPTTRFGAFTSEYPTHPPKQIALLIPQSGNQAIAGRAIRDGFLAAYYSTGQGSNVPKIKEYDTAQDGNIVTTYQRAISEGADFVVGPLDKKDVQALSTNGKMPVPTLALNYLDLNSSSPALMYQFGLSPQDEAKQAADKAWQDGHHRVLLITPTGNWGQGIAKIFGQQWQTYGGEIIGNLTYNNTETLSDQLKQVLQYKENKEHPIGSDGHWRHTKITGERRQDIDAIFLVASPDIARQIRPLLKFYYAGQIPVYATSLVYSGNPSPSSDRDIDGILFCDIPWVFNNPPTLSNIQNQIAARWPNNFLRNRRLYALGVDAYQLSNAQLMQLINLRNTTINGATGTLYLDNHQHVLRKLQWAQFKDGIPVPIG